MSRSIERAASEARMSGDEPLRGLVFKREVTRGKDVVDGEGRYSLASREMSGVEDEISKCR
jgi:hypothetical protein